jgi:hypothetical protein
MQDSYGDGWNGGSLTVFVNGVSVGNFSAAGYGSVDSFLVCNTDSVRLFYTDGQYENENTYQLYDASSNLLFANGPNPALGNVFTTFGNCSTVSSPGTNPCTAVAIDTGQCLVGTNVGFQTTGLNPGCANYQGPDVWYQTTVPPSGSMVVATDSGSINDTGLAIWTGNSCFGLQRLACDDDSGPDYFSRILLGNLVPGQTLYIQVFGYGNSMGTFRLCVDAQPLVVLDSTELPIVMINTLSQTIVEDTKINCQMDIKYNGPNTLTRVSDPSNVYSGNIGIEIRGASSASYPQHPYNIETRTGSGGNNNVSLLGMPAENDWVLLSNYNDLTLTRNSLAFALFDSMGHYAPRTILCEVLIDSVYQGIYVFGEKIKQDNDRVDIAKLDADDNAGDSLTGGYILQQNYWNANNSFQSNYSPIDHPTFDVHFVYEYPKPDVITAPQKAYIAAFVDSLETALYSTNFADSLQGYRKYMSMNSFIDYFIVNEVARNADGFKKSVFFHKDKFSNGGKLKAGPVWDFDWAWKNIQGCTNVDNIDGSGWAYKVNDCFTDNYSTGWYVRLLQDPAFQNQLRCRYEGFRQTVLDTAYIFASIEATRQRVRNAQERHFQKWPILGQSGPAPEVNPVATTYDGALDTLKFWIHQRLQWLDANIPGIAQNCAPLTAASEPIAPWSLAFYPNPSQGDVHFEGFLQQATPAHMRIYNVNGQLIDTITLQPGNIHLDYHLAAKGMYFFEVRGETGLLDRGKMVVQ